jgi:putative ABC transport system permease protein
MTALYSVNLRIMGRPNIALLSEETIRAPMDIIGMPQFYAQPLVAAIVVAVAAALLARWLNSEHGLGVRAAGANPRMARSNGVSVSKAIYVGLALSNGLAALAGAVFSQLNGFADVTLGVGTIVVGLAAVILGEVIFRSKTILVAVIACVLGSVLYRLTMQVALNTDALGLQASDLNLLTAFLVIIALALPRLRLAIGVAWLPSQRRKTDGRHAQ